MSAPTSSVGVRRLRRDAPAKINLGLRVVGRRADGYHLLDSLFVPLDLCDEVAVAVEPADGENVVRIEVSGRSAGVPADARNLAARAASAFAERAGLRHRIAVQLDKRIPTGAGLGGGSSDAGAVLRLLSELFPGAVGPGDLAAVALELGADVPFFLDPRPARVGGVGERIEPLADLPALPVLLVNPGAELGTAGVYAAFDALTPALTTPEGETRIPPPSATPWRYSGVDSLDLHNDLEAAAIRLCPPVARIRDRVGRLGPAAVGMSGSGPTLFGIFGSAGAAQEALEEAAFELPIWARVAATVESR